MKIPEKTNGQHKLRDTKICMMWAKDLVSAEKISERFKLSTRRIYQIVYTNRDFLKIEKEWEKSKRVRWYQQQIKKRGDSKKDSADLQDKLRVELEGNLPIVSIDNSQHSHYDLREISNKENPIGNRIKDFASQLSERNRG